MSSAKSPICYRLPGLEYIPDWISVGVDEKDIPNFPHQKQTDPRFHWNFNVLWIIAIAAFFSFSASPTHPDSKKRNTNAIAPPNDGKFTYVHQPEKNKFE